MGVVIGFPVLSAWAMQTVPASHGGVVLGLLPLATAVVAVCISNERPSIRFWISGVAGSILVIAYSFQKGLGSFHLVDLALFGAILCAAIGYAVGGQLSKTTRTATDLNAGVLLRKSWFIPIKMFASG